VTALRGGSDAVDAMLWAVGECGWEVEGEWGGVRSGG